VTAGEALAEARRRLAATGADSARIDAVRLLEAILGRDAAWLLAHDRDDLEAASLRAFEDAVRRREAGEPVAYITGTAGFFGRTFAVTRDVLVPRPETEQLAELALAALRRLGRASPAFCDVGTGSGILALTLACELPEARGIAVDLSAAALAVASRNAAALGVASRVTFAHGDLLAAVPAEARFDCLVANLPYVPHGELAAPPDPTTFEPRLALDGGADGLDLYRRLLPALARHLTPQATVLFEAGPSTAAPLAALAAAAFPTAQVEIHPDYAGHPRTIEITTGPAATSP
jgi:release factor glutamine methyltransferase